MVYNFMCILTLSLVGTARYAVRTRKAGAKSAANRYEATIPAALPPRTPQLGVPTATSLPMKKPTVGTVGLLLKGKLADRGRTAAGQIQPANRAAEENQAKERQRIGDWFRHGRDIQAPTDQPVFNRAGTVIPKLQTPGVIRIQSVEVQKSCGIAYIVAGTTSLRRVKVDKRGRNIGAQNEMPLDARIASRKRSRALVEVEDQLNARNRGGNAADGVLEGQGPAALRNHTRIGVSERVNRGVGRQAEHRGEQTGNGPPPQAFVFMSCVHDSLFSVCSTAPHRPARNSRCGHPAFFE